ncbi:histone-lysine N-methyltransferase 2D [Cocos nucifera]|nr:histone-lysine N-methyltransferase 2D [Cocos nucifera]
METLVVVAQHRNQYYTRGKSQISDMFGAAPFRGFKGINCRTFQSGAGILPPPPSFPSAPEPRSPCFYSEPPKQSRRSKPILISPSTSPKRASFHDELSYSELWAGPAYSNSPPPSSLPIPKFSLRQKRSISLELPGPPSEITLHPLSKSAPSSPTRKSGSSDDDFFLSTTTATENLRRILHLDIADD